MNEIKIGTRIQFIVPEHENLPINVGQTAIITKIRGFGLFSYKMEDDYGYIWDGDIGDLNKYYVIIDKNDVENSTNKHKCSCNFLDLLRSGCKCGGI